MNDIVEIWRSSPIPEGPWVVRKALPQDVRDRVTALLAGLHDSDPDCAYGVAHGETAGFAPGTHEEHSTIIDIRRAEMSGS